MLGAVTALDDVLRRLVTDPVFRARLERDPAATLDGLDLSERDLSRIDAALRGPAATVDRFFADPPPASGSPPAAT